MAQEPKSENQKTKAKNQDSKLPNYQVTELSMFQSINVPIYQCSNLSMFQVIMQLSDPAISPRNEEREPKCKNRKTRTEEQNLRSEILGTKSLEQKLWSKKAPIFRFLGGKIDQKSDFWNIVLRCSEREASCTFVITWLRHSMQR